MLETGAYLPTEQGYDTESTVYHGGSNLPPMRRPGDERYTFASQSPQVPYVFTDMPPPPSYDDISKESPPAFPAPEYTDVGSSQHAEVSPASLSQPATSPAPLPTYQASEQAHVTQTNPEVQETQ